MINAYCEKCRCDFMFTTVAERTAWALHRHPSGHEVQIAGPRT